MKTRFVKVVAVAVVAMMMITLVAAITQIDLASQVKGVLAKVNGGAGADMTNVTFPSTGTLATAAATLTSGQLLIGGGTTAANVGNLSGDVTTAGSAVTTVVKVNGTSVPTNAAADQVLVTSGSAAGSWATLPNGVATYSTASHTFSLASVMAGTFVDAEVPTGAIDGSNAAFTLAHTPSPAGSLQLYKNGQLMIAGGSDFTLATATATFVTAAKPKVGDVLIAIYRY